MNERQQMIMELLIHSSSPVPIDTIVSHAKKSKRTVLRDLSSIKTYLENENIGELINVHNGYKVNIIQSEKYKDLLNQYINDEEVILYELIQRRYLTMDDLSECLYVSKITASEKMNNVKSSYAKYLNIEVSRKGHNLNEPVYKKCILLSNLIENNLKHYLHLFHVSYDSYLKLEECIEYDKHIRESFPNCTISQIAYLFLAACFYQGEYIDHDDEEFLKYYRKANIKADHKADVILQAISLNCLDINLSLSKERITRILNIMKKDMHIEFDEEDELILQLYAHLKRVLCYPHYLKMKEIYNISNFKTLYPFSFDLSMMFIQYLERMYHYEIPNSDFIGLYFAVCLDKLKMKKRKIILYSSHNAVAYLNKQLLTDFLNDIEIIITEIIEDEDLSGVSLIIDSIGDLSCKDITVINMNRILSEQDMNHIQTVLDNVSIHKNKFSIFSRNQSFEYHVKENDTWMTILDAICLKLQETNILNYEEAVAIMNRENQGSTLIINDYIIPHCISKKENYCICVYIHLDKEIIVEQCHVHHVLVTILNPAIQKNINIFKFLYNYLNENKERLQNISTYDEFIEGI